MTYKFDRQTFGNPENTGNLLNRDEINILLDEWIENEKLKTHSLQVATLMEAWAKETGKSEDEILAWWMAGVLHDADWDQWPEQHPKKIVEYLESKNIDAGVIHAIASHSPKHFGVEPVSEMDKMIYAFDELSGLVNAYSLMRGGFDGMEVKGVKKKLKDKTFAAGVDREDIKDAVQKADIELDKLIEFVIKNIA